MTRLRGYLAKVACSTANVLITGETGTGKQCVAELIHQLGPRRSNSFVAVNCAAIPDSLFESEMFGYEPGAFTGALEKYVGKLRIAAGGTVFLDEIGEMSLMAQAKILRVIESREVFPLGARRVSRIDARFVAATNQEPEPLVREHRFRQDLFYRLNVARIHVQPLKDRKEDIPELLAHFVRHFNNLYNCQVGSPTVELMECLLQYEWPGNVRELRNLVESIFIDPPSGHVSLDHLPDSFRHAFEPFVKNSMPERDRLLSVLCQTNWNKKKAAAEMNWSRMTLYRKLSKYSIACPESSPLDSGD